MKLLRKDAHYKLKRPLKNLPMSKLIDLKGFLISAGNAHLLKGQFKSYARAYRLLNQVNAHIKFFKEKENARRTANKVSKN